jgi:hypothetical protein
LEDLLQRKSEECEDPDDDEECPIKDKLLKEAQPFLAENTEKVKRILTAGGIDITKRDIKPTCVKVINLQATQLLKVSLADSTYEKVTTFLNSETCRGLLEEEDVFIHDVDFTRDHMRLFCKQELIRYLLNEEDFRMAKFASVGTTEGTAYIIDKNRLASRNCLTFVRGTDNGTVRYKLYNKFVQSMESPSVRGKVGSHVADWVNNPEKELYYAIPKSMDTGLLRLEITFYRNNTKKQIDPRFIESQMDYLEQLIPQHLLFYNPISVQYELLLERVQSNTCIIDTDKKIALFSLYLNRETGKTNGFYVKESCSNKISNILKYYTFDLPISVILLKRDGENIRLQQDTYIRRLEVGKKRDPERLVTYVSAGTIYFKQRPLHVGEKQPHEMGLLDNVKVRL